MNYLRGAVNAISAPYSYYKEINPSTLTGAIDVIVVQSPSEDGDTVLSCSPFHVRFGKWQVLRPSDKKVNVSVNGHPIPFAMKIGEAGEAFFVFETDDDIPEELVTSPLLRPTDDDDAEQVPGDSNQSASDQGTGRFGTQRTIDDMQDASVVTGTEEQDAKAERGEPTFLDLNATSDDYEDALSTAIPPNTAIPPSLTRMKPPNEPDMDDLDPNSIESEQDRRVDEALRRAGARVHVPDVDFRQGYALDTEGYHARLINHPKEESEETVTENSEAFRSDFASSLAGSGVPFPSANNASVPFPRASSEPPPDEDDQLRQDFQQLAIERPETPTQRSLASEGKGLGLSIPIPQQEYSWEWGAFPQPSPMSTTFANTPFKVDHLTPASRSKTTGRNRKSRMTDSLAEDVVAEDPQEEDYRGRIAAYSDHHRSYSVPPEVEGSPIIPKRKLPAEEGDKSSSLKTKRLSRTLGYGAGGTLTRAKSDPTLFIVKIEGQRSLFELSVIEETDNEADISTLFNGRDEVEAARAFARGKVDFEQFLRDDSVVNHPRLVIRWAGDSYIKRSDGSPLMGALSLWRTSALARQAVNPESPRPDSPSEPSRPSSPLSDEEESMRSGVETTPPTSADEGGDDSLQTPFRAKSEPLEDTRTPKPKPTSSSWVRWWTRSKQTQGASSSPVSAHPDFRPVSEPVLDESARLPLEDREADRPVRPPTRPADSAPALPSTPVEAQAPPSAPVIEFSEETGKRYAKTLRLTSDQLKSLNLHPGANTITFSLSATGTIACTARIFVWDSTDLICISDIDGTITKSDGLGHVFAMIGRDWTHMGVAKLYTDITRNGYKIMYLTSRAIGQADATRGYLKGIKQNNYQLPEGPVIMSPDRLMASLHREVIMRKPEVFKMACLRDIQRLFGPGKKPFYAGFGNRITDALSYRSVNVPSSRIFTIDSTGEVKLELLELAGYKSSYIHMTDLVDQMFPPIHRKWAPEFTDFNYWKPSVQEFPLPDLSPPSPALSARSDTSNASALTRLRNFSLVGSASKPVNVPGSSARKSPDPGQATLSSSPSRSTSSSFGRRSASPPSWSSSDDEDADDMDAELRRQYRRERATSITSITSMPGSLNDFALNEEDEDRHVERIRSESPQPQDNEDEVQDDEEDSEDAFDEDLLAAGEMQNVPFL